MRVYSPNRWKIILFDPDGESSCLPKGEAEEIADRLKLLEDVSEVEIVRIPFAGRSEDECLCLAAKHFAERNRGRLLLYNLHYSDIKVQTVGKALSLASDRAVVSVRSEMLAVHRFFSMRTSQKGETTVILRTDKQGVPVEKWVGPSHAAPEPGPNTFVIRGKLCTADEADRSDQFEIPDKWRFDVRGRRWRLSGSNREICGRKEFPQVHRVSDALVAGPVDSLARLERNIHDGGVGWVLLDGIEARRISNPIDLLRSKLELWRVSYV